MSPEDRSLHPGQTRQVSASFFTNTCKMSAKSISIYYVFLLIITILHIKSTRSGTGKLLMVANYHDIIRKTFNLLSLIKIHSNFNTFSFSIRNDFLRLLLITLCMFLTALTPQNPNYLFTFLFVLLVSELFF